MLMPLLVSGPNFWGPLASVTWTQPVSVSVPLWVPTLGWPHAKRPRLPCHLLVDAWSAAECPRPGSATTAAHELGAQALGTCRRAEPARARFCERVWLRTASLTTAKPNSCAIIFSCGAAAARTIQVRRNHCQKECKGCTSQFPKKTCKLCLPMATSSQKNSKLFAANN